MFCLAVMERDGKFIELNIWDWDDMKSYIECNLTDDIYYDGLVTYNFKTRNPNVSIENAIRHIDSTFKQYGKLVVKTNENVVFYVWKIMEVM